MKKVLKRYDIIIAILMFLVAIPAERYEWFSSMEEQLESIRHSMRFSFGDPAKSVFPQDKVIIIAQDDDYFEEYGSYPPKWVDYGKIIENLNFLGAKVIMVDFLFEFKSSYGEDPLLAKYLAEAGNTIFVKQIQQTGLAF